MAYVNANTSIRLQLLSDQVLINNIIENCNSCHEQTPIESHLQAIPCRGLICNLEDVAGSIDDFFLLGLLAKRIKNMVKIDDACLHARFRARECLLF